ncbi:hypothetical protein Q1695_008602 [Nippostrongylus brasiliensis]|nr:hypothetical protein Q1695_008602 [Nippostrongylus brasiliensis]
MSRGHFHKFAVIMKLREMLFNCLNRMFPSKRELLRNAGIELKPAEPPDDTVRKPKRTLLFQDHNFE